MPTPNLDLEYIAVSQSQKEIVHNDNMDIIDSKLAGIISANDGQLLGVDGGNTIGVDLGDGLSIVADTLEVRDASITDSGFINTIAQAFMGIKTFVEGIVIGANSGIDLIDGEDTYKTTIKANLENVEDILFILPPDWGTPDYSLCTDGDGNLFWASRLENAITELNGLSGASQTLAIGTSGTNITWSSSGTAHTLNIPDASASARGVVTTGTQTFVGNKNFAGRLLVNGATADGRAMSIRGITSGSFSDLISFYNAAGTLKWHFSLLNGEHLSYTESGVLDGILTIFKGGNIGIGSGTATSVSSRLWNKSGGNTSATTNFRALNSSNTDLFTIRDDGRVDVLVGPLIAGRQFVSGVVTLTDAATIATDASLGNLFRVTLAGNRTLGNPTNMANGQRIMWEIIQDGTGSRTLAFDTKFGFGSDIPSVTLTTTPDKRDFIEGIYNSTTDKVYIIRVFQGY